MSTRLLVLESLTRQWYNGAMIKGSKQSSQRQLPEGWAIDKKLGLIKSYQTKNFVDSIRLGVEIAELAELMGHHPRLVIDYAELEVSSITHSEGGLTDKDYELAKNIDKIYNEG